MIRNYLLFFIRNLMRQRVFSLINLLGLTIGIVSSLLIYLHVNHELSYDKFHSKADHIYRVNQTFIWGENNDQLFSSTGPGVAYALKAEIPGIEQVTRIHPSDNTLITYVNEKNEAKSFDEKNIFAVDSNFFDVFSFQLVKGSVESALMKPQSIVMTESTARRYFDDAEPIGKLLTMEGVVEDKNFSTTTVSAANTFQVTAIVKDPPDNSYIDFDMLVSMNSFQRIREGNWSWIWTTFETFVVFDEKVSVEAAIPKLSLLPRKYAATTLERSMGVSYDEYMKSGKQWNLYLQPLTDIHLHSGAIYNRLNDVGDIKILYVLMGVVAFIILLSCVNFMNLSTAQYMRRAKEASLRKVLGSTRWQISKGFFMEAFLFCCIAILLGILVAGISLPYFNDVTGKNYELSQIFGKNVIILMACLLIIVSLLSGSYPAIYLSAFSPIDAIRGKLKTGKEGKRLRNGLVVFQFTASIILIICTLTVFRQLKFLSQKDIGFNRENLLVVDRVEWIKDKETFISALTHLAGVEGVTWCSSAPPRLYDGDQFKAEGNSEKAMPLNYVKADEHFIPTLDIKLKTGRNFSADIPADLEHVILNETAVKEFGWPNDEQVIGKKIEYPGMNRKFEVIGVVKDFNYWSLQAPIEPMAIFHAKGPVFSNNLQYAALRIAPMDVESWNKLIENLQQHWKQFAGDQPFQYSFVDETFAASFEEEKRFGKMLSLFAGLAILIASLGLLGMIIFTLELRTKEIGIRKVIGASVLSILTLISKDYTKLVILAILFSIPVSIWLMDQWLTAFEYRIKQDPWVFILAGIAALFITITITGYHSLKAALSNPVDVLKDE